MCPVSFLSQILSLRNGLNTCSTVDLHICCESINQWLQLCWYDKLFKIYSLHSPWALFSACSTFFFLIDRYLGRGFSHLLLTSYIQDHMTQMACKYTLMTLCSQTFKSVLNSFFCTSMSSWSFLLGVQGDVWYLPSLPFYWHFSNFFFFLYYKMWDVQAPVGRFVIQASQWT